MSENTPVVEVEEPKTEEAKTNDIPTEPAPQIIPPSEPVRMKKPHYGGRKKDPNTVDRYSRTTCPDCNRSLSIHGLKYTHRCPAKKNIPRIIEEELPAAPVITQETKDINSKVAQQFAQKEPEPPKLPRRIVDLDQDIRHDDPHVHTIVHSYLRNLKAHETNTKREKYRSMLNFFR